MNRFLYIFFLALLGFACDNEGENKDANSDTAVHMDEKLTPDTTIITAGHDARNSLDWAGTYKGVLPCADCEGIETEIMLHSDSTYMLSGKYLGKKDGALLKEDGAFTWVDGSTIELKNSGDRPARYFVAENRIIQLDRDGKRIEGKLADKYILTKTNP